MSTKSMKPTSQAGFSLIETLVALVILGVALTSIVPVFVNYASVNRSTEVRGEAVSAAEQVMDGLRQRSFNDWKAFANSAHNGGVQVATGKADDDSDNGRTYVPVIEWCGDDLDLCDDDEEQQRHVRVTMFLDGEEKYSVTTVFTNVQGNDDD